jgi:hypothetical protein
MATGGVGVRRRDWDCHGSMWGIIVRCVVVCRKTRLSGSSIMYTTCR